MRETAVERYLRLRVKQTGGITRKFVSPGQRHVPDRIVMYPGGLLVFVECKRPGEKPNPGQLREHERLRALGQVVHVIDSFEAADQLARTYGRAPV